MFMKNNLSLFFHEAKLTKKLTFSKFIRFYPQQPAAQVLPLAAIPAKPGNEFITLQIISRPPLRQLKRP